MRAPLIYFLSAILFLTAGCATLPEHYVSLQDQRVSSLEEILHQIKDEKVIFLGERHEITEDHLVQLEVVRLLHEDGKNVVIALEMFPAEAQSILNKWVGGEISENDFKSAYYSTWSVSYENYSNIFEYARQVRIPLAGINGPEVLINNVAKTGIENLPRDFRKAVKVPSCSQLPEYSRMINFFEKRIAHGSKMPFFCEAQLLRDSLMAYHIAGVLGRGNFTVVALVGATHALKMAVPKILINNYNVKSAVLMSKQFVDIISPELKGDIADYIWY